MPSDIRRLREAILNYLREHRFEQPLAVTLTMKRAIAKRGERHWIDETQCKQNLRHFLNVISQRLYRGAARRGRRLRCLSVLEYSDTVRPHYHLIVEKPKHMSAAM